MYDWKRILITVNGKSGTLKTDLVILWQGKLTLQDGIRPDILARFPGKLTTEGISIEQRAEYNLERELRINLANEFTLRISDNRDVAYE